MMALFSDRGMGEDLLDLQRDDPADLVVVDCLLMGAMDAARRAGLTYVPLEHLFDEYLRRRWMRGPLGLAGKARGLRPVHTLNAAPLNLVALAPGARPRIATSAAGQPRVLRSGRGLARPPATSRRGSPPCS